MVNYDSNYLAIKCMSVSCSCSFLVAILVLVLRMANNVQWLELNLAITSTFAKINSFIISKEVVFTFISKTAIAVSNKYVRVCAGQLVWGSCSCCQAEFQLKSIIMGEINGRLTYRTSTELKTLNGSATLGQAMRNCMTS